MEEEGGRGEKAGSVGRRGAHTRKVWNPSGMQPVCTDNKREGVGCDAIWKRHKICGKK